MAIERKGYGQLELNAVAFRRDGRIEAQMPYDVSVEGTKYENGMVVILDKHDDVVKVGEIAKGDLYGIVYTSEELYDTRKPGLKNFGVEVINGEAKGPEGYDVLPRIGFLAIGDRFTTNTVVKTDPFTKGAEAYVSATGEWTATKPNLETYGGPIGVVADDKATMPDGQAAIKIAIIKA